ASTYTDRAVAEATVAQALTQNSARIAAWSARSGSRPNLALDYRGRNGVSIGRSLERSHRQPSPCLDAVVVLRWDGRPTYYVLTSYPELRR
ncbi:MAG: RNase A-like domain-containing protein, partial [Acidobacteriota bacterium]